MKTIIEYLKRYKIISFLAPLFKMLEAIFDLLVPIVMAKMIDIGIAAGSRSYILKCCIILFVLAAAGLAVAVTAQYFAAKSAANVTGDLRADLFSHIMSFSDAVYESFGAEALITRMTSDITQVQNGINMFLRLFLRSPFIVAGAIVMAAFISMPAAVMFIVIVVILSLVVMVISGVTLPVFTNIQAKLEHLMLLVDENIEGVRVIRAFGVEEVQRKKFHESTDSLYTYQHSAGAVQALLNPATYIVVNLGIVAILYYSGIAVKAGSLTQGQVVALLNYLSQILVELIKFASLIVLITKGIASAKRVEEIMLTEPDERRKAGSGKSENPVNQIDMDKGKMESEPEPAISFEDVSFYYQNNRAAAASGLSAANGAAAAGGLSPDSEASAVNAVEHVSFKLYRGETLGIVGGTGSGKSTLTRLIRHAYDTSGGSVKLFGKDAACYTDEEISSMVSVVPQRVTLFSGTVASNLRLGNNSISDESLKTALKQAQAEDFVNEKGGLNAGVRRFGSNFSGGQRQRLTIARALAAPADPERKLLILDDSSSALDLATEAKLLRGLSEETSLTKIIISQRASSVLNADRILVMDDGRCVGLGTNEELLESCKVYREIYYAQFPERQKETEVMA